MLLAWYDEELTLGLDDFSSAWIGNSVIAAAQANHVPGTLTIEAVQLVNAFTADTGFITTGHSTLVNILFAEFSCEACLADTTELFLLVH